MVTYTIRLFILFVPIWMAFSAAASAEVFKLTDTKKFTTDSVWLWFFLLKGTGGVENAFSGAGLQLWGEGGSRLTANPVTVVPVVPPSIDYVISNEPPAGETSAGRALILRFDRPVVRAGLWLSGAGETPTAVISAFGPRAQPLGSISHSVKELEGLGSTFVGIETDNPEGFMTLVVDYGTSLVAERLHKGVLIEDLSRRSFVSAVPQLASGQTSGHAVQSLVQLQNVFGQPIQVRMAFFNQFGEPLALKLDGQETSQIEFELPLRGHRRFQTSGDGPLKLGYARIESTGFPVTGQAIFQTATIQGTKLEEAAILASEGKLTHQLYIEVDPTTNVDSALAFANLGGGQTSVSFSVFSGEDYAPGFEGPAFFVLDKDEQRAAFVTELFPFLRERKFEGVVVVSATSPVALTVVRTVDGVAVSALPGGSTAK